MLTYQNLLLILAGSFLPNNLLALLFKRLWRNRRLLREKHGIKLISPKRYFAKFESDPKTQYAYHKKLVKFWMANFIPMNMIVGVDIWATLNNHSELALLMTAILLAINTNYSLYANWDTETGDAHAAYASIRTDEIQEAALTVTAATTESLLSTE